MNSRRLLTLHLLLALVGYSLSQAPPLAELRKTAEQQPHSAPAQSNYGTGLKAAGRLDEALDRFDAALQIDPHYARAYNNMGNAFQARGDYKTAVTAHGTAIKLMPQLASAYSNLGNALRELGEPVTAVEALESAIALNPLYGAAYTNLGAATLALGGPENARRAAQWLKVATVLSGGRDPSTLSNLGAALEAAGQVQEAGAVLDDALTLQPASAVLHVNRGNILRRVGRVGESVSAYLEALNLEPDGADAATAYNNMASSLQAEGELERAMQAYDAALALQPEHASARANRDKLPISPAYRGAASYESTVLASRAARALLSRPSGSAGAAASLAHGLHRVVRYLRRLETKQLPESTVAPLWQGRAQDMPKTLSAQGGGGGMQSPMTLAAFAWGGVWYQTLAAVFTHPTCRAALSGGGSAVVLGSSIGFEAYFASLTYGVPTVGVEVLCSLTRLSDDIRVAHGVPSSLTRFECADALAFRLPRDTMLVYVDDTAWDAPTVSQLAAKLSRELPSGAIVVHNTQEAYQQRESGGGGGGGRLRYLQTYEVGTSWNARHPVHVHAVA
jgi:tetratricopeptide (TPR) repeat protein